MIEKWLLFLIATLLLPTIFRGIAFLTGWSSLAARYGSKSRIDGRLWRVRPVSLLRGRNRVVYFLGFEFVIGSTEVGIRPAFPFSWGHAPLVVPKNEMRVCELLSVGGLPSVQLDMGEGLPRIEVVGSEGARLMDLLQTSQRPEG